MVAGQLVRNGEESFGLYQGRRLVLIRGTPWG